MSRLCILKVLQLKKDWFQSFYTFLFRLVLQYLIFINYGSGIPHLMNLDNFLRFPTNIFSFYPGYFWNIANPNLWMLIFLICFYCISRTHDCSKCFFRPRFLLHFMTGITILKPIWNKKRYKKIGGRSPEKWRFYLQSLPLNTWHCVYHYFFSAMVSQVRKLTVISTSKDVTLYDSGHLIT